MAAINHLQLQLFMHPQDFDRISKNDFTVHDWDDDHGWSVKEAEARSPRGSGEHGAGVYDSIKERGFDQDQAVPIYASKWYGLNLKDGHHRVAASRALQREGRDVWVPVNYLGTADRPEVDNVSPTNYKGEPDYDRYDYYKDPDPPGGWRSHHKNVPQEVVRQHRLNRFQQAARAEGVDETITSSVWNVANDMTIQSRPHDPMQP